MRCPFCDSPDVELVSPFAGQIITSQFRCRTCNSYFEGVRDDFDRRDPPEPDG
jgi:transposase-like protein